MCAGELCGSSCNLKVLVNYICFSFFIVASFQNNRKLASGMSRLVVALRGVERVDPKVASKMLRRYILGNHADALRIYVCDGRDPRVLRGLLDFISSNIAVGLEVYLGCGDLREGEYVLLDVGSSAES
jgi:hypothetical protein